MLKAAAQRRSRRRHGFCSRRQPSCRRCDKALAAFVRTRESVRMGVFVNRAHLCMQGTDSGESGRVWASITRQRPRGSGVGSTAKGKGRGAVVWAHTSETPSLLQSAVLYIEEEQNPKSKWPFRSKLCVELPTIPSGCLAVQCFRLPTRAGVTRSKVCRYI